MVRGDQRLLLADYSHKRKSEPRKSVGDAIAGLWLQPSKEIKMVGAIKAYHYSPSRQLFTVSIQHSGRLLDAKSGPATMENIEAGPKPQVMGRSMTRLEGAP